MNNEGEIFYQEITSHLEEIRKEVVLSLGKEKAFHVSSIHWQIWFQLNEWIISSSNEPLNIFFLMYQRIHKSIAWIQILFLNCNYDYIYRDLRYILEMMYKAQNAFDNKPQIDEQYEYFLELDSSEKFSWKNIRPQIVKMINSNNLDPYNNLWNRLNSHIHPSMEQIEQLISKDGKAFITDSFNKELSLETLSTIDQVFDLIFLLVTYQYPFIKKLLREHHSFNQWKDFIPLTSALCNTTD